MGKIPISDLRMKSNEIEVKSILEKEGEQRGGQLQEWNDVFDILMWCRKCGLSEMYAHSILSNRYVIIPTD